MRPIQALTALLLVGASTGAFAQAQRPSPNLGEQSMFEVDVRRWRSDLVSELRLSTPAAPGSDVNPVLDLGLPAERTFDYHFAVRITDRIRVRGNWFRVSYDADTVTNRELTIAGDVYSAGSIVTSSLKLEQRRGGLRFDFLRGDYGWVGVIGEWARFIAENEYSSVGEQTGPVTLRMDLLLAGLGARVYLTPALALSVEAVGMKRDSIGVMTDVDASITYNAIPNLGFTYGYRNSYNRFRENEPADRVIYRLRGQYFGVIVRF